MFLKKKKKKGIDANYKEMVRFDKLGFDPRLPEIERAYYLKMRDAAAAMIDWKRVPEALWPKTMKSEETNYAYA